jgi:hypothetical protein
VENKNVKEVINNTKLVEDFRGRGGRLIHIMGKTRGMTVAFIPKNGRVEISTSVQHRNDHYTKKIGTKLAVEHFNEGRTIFLPARPKGITNMLYNTLSYIVE